MMLKPVNYVGGGEFGRELDLDVLSREIEAEYNPEAFPGLILRTEGATCLVFRSGKFVITGAENHSELIKSKNRLCKALVDNNVIDDHHVPIDIYNIVFKGDLDNSVNLEGLTILLGLENVEYEPEQSPFLVYRPPEVDCVITVSSSGKIVINGVTSESSAKDAYNVLSKRLRDSKL